MTLSGEGPVPLRARAVSPSPPVAGHFLICISTPAPPRPMATPWVVETSSTVTPFWFFIAATPAPPAAEGTRRSFGARAERSAEKCDRSTSLHPFRRWTGDRHGLGKHARDLAAVPLGKPHLGSGERSVELRRPPRSDDRHVHGRVGDGPGHRELRQRDATPVGILLQPLDHVHVLPERLPREIGAVAPPVVGREFRLRRDAPREQPVGER